MARASFAGARSTSSAVLIAASGVLETGATLPVTAYVLVRNEDSASGVSTYEIVSLTFSAP
jgi:hypothetical protein